MRYLGILGLVTLAACGSAGGEEARLDRLVDRAEAIDEMVLFVQDLSRTRSDRVPTTSSASFTGHSGLIIDPNLFAASDDIVLLGDVALQVSYSSAGAVTGVADNFDGIVGTGETWEFADTSGRIVIGGNASSLGPDGSREDWSADYEGTLTVNGTQYVIDGVLDGELLGNRVNDDTPQTYVVAVYGLDLDGVGRNGDAVAPVLFEVVATNP